MTDIDLDVENHLEVREALADIEDDWSDAPAFEIHNDAEYAPYLEYGTRKMPPYPFFRPAINEYMAGPNALVRKQQGVGLSDASTVDELVYLLTVSLNQQVQANLRADKASGRSPGTHPDHPQVETGNLLGHQDWEKL